MEEVAGRTLDEDGFVVQDLNRRQAKPKANKEADAAVMRRSTEAQKTLLLRCT